MKKHIESVLRKGIEALQQEGAWPVFEVPKIEVTYPKNRGFGDYASNIAMVLVRLVGKSPMEIAETLKGKLELKEIEKIEVAAPGYLNFSLSASYLQAKVKQVGEEGANFGDSNLGHGIKVNNEFISANPTGPLTVGNGRGGFCGDALARVLRKTGFVVTNEYYVNDAGEQILKLGHSVLKDEEAVYGGEYIEELHAKFGAIQDVREVGKQAAEYVLEEMIKETVSDKMQIAFDVWISERKDVVESGDVDKALASLEEKGLTYEQEGAVWLKTSEFGDDKDRVLVKQDGTRTYFASDCGYILNKIERGFQVLVESWGADHHGYINRFKAAAQMLGFEGELRFIIVQLVKLVKDGKEVRMSKRAGNVVTIDELIEKVGHDVTRFFFLMHAPDTHMNFDLGLAEEQSQKNPVYYVQYAHARIASILRKAEEANFSLEGSMEHSHLLVRPKEWELMKDLALFPEFVEEIAESYEVHKLPHYAIRLADKFHSFYNECKVIDEENPELTEARLQLVKAVKIVLAETLHLIGVDAPERM
jgi:arginyl-tRNA synthetase